MRSIVPRVAGAILAALLAASPVQASTIKFETIAPDGGLRNVRPGRALNTDGYRFTSLTGESAVFADDSGYSMLGDPTAVFGFAGGETITMSDPTHGAFNLAQLLLGPSNIGSGTTDITLTGFTFDHDISETAVFLGLTTATLETLDWADLSYVTMTATTDSSFDDVVVTDARNAGFQPASVPEPASAALLAAGLLWAWRADAAVYARKTLLFLKKKTQKTFTHWRQTLRRRRGVAPVQEFFLLLFFKKEALPYF